MKPVSGEKTPVEIISRSERVLGPSATLRSPSALPLRSSRSSSGARRSTSEPPCGMLVVYSISTFIGSPPGKGGVWGREPAPHASGEARHTVIPGTLAHNPQPQLPRERVGNKGSVLDDAGALFGGILEAGAGLRSQLGGLAGQRQSLSRVVQSVPHRIVFDRGTVRPGVVAQVLFVVYKQRGVRIEGPLQAAEGHPFVQSV